MDDRQFDRLARLASAAPTRRGALAGLLGGFLVPLAGAEAEPVHPAVCHRLGKKCDKRRGDHCCGKAKCRGGRCRCHGKRKRCQGQCIPKANCCDAADCGDGGACQDGVCLCLSGFKWCEGGCLPEDECCGECAVTDVCRNGACVAICGPDACPDPENPNCVPQIDGTPGCWGGTFPFLDRLCDVPCAAMDDCPPPHFLAAIHCVYSDGECDSEFVCAFLS